MGKRRSSKQRVVVPIVLAVSVAGAAASALSSMVAGCDSGNPPVDASPFDTRPDIPPI